MLEGRAVHVPELGGVVIGLTPGDRYLCAYVFDERVSRGGGARGGRRSRGSATTTATRREMVSLAYMGRGRFIVSRPVDMVDECGRVTSHFTSFLALELMRLRAADGELVLAKRGSLTVTGQGGWADGKILYSVVVSILRAISIEQKLLISLLMM